MKLKSIFVRILLFGNHFRPISDCWDMIQSLTNRVRSSPYKKNSCELSKRALSQILFVLHWIDPTLAIRPDPIQKKDPFTPTQNSVGNKWINPVIYEIDWPQYKLCGCIWDLKHRKRRFEGNFHHFKVKFLNFKSSFADLIWNFQF